MINLHELSLSDIMPPSIKNDHDIDALSKALDNQLQQISRMIYDAILLPRIDELSEELVDLLAWQLHVDFYEPLGLDLSKKKALIKNSISWHRRKGTKSVLDEMINVLYFKDFEIQEWFEYGGEPYHFKILINNECMPSELYDKLIRAVNELKNVRSWLEAIESTTELFNYIYTATAFTSIHEHMEIPHNGRYGAG